MICWKPCFQYINAIFNIDYKRESAYNQCFFAFLLDLYTLGDTKSATMCVQANFIFVKGYEEAIPVKCGKCLECLQERSNEWAYRIMLESKNYANNCFLTLTYKDNPVSLKKKDFQLFMKRLRKKLSPLKIRYFACGEYGKKGKRPHYHAIIFNWSPTNDDIICNVPGEKSLFRSRTLESVWTYGFSSFGQLTFDSAKYCAKYMQKMNDFPQGCEKPFTLMSNKPGIAFDYVNQNEDFLIDDKIYNNSHYIKTPRYFLKVLERQGYDLTAFKERRLKNALLHKDIIDTDELKLKEKKSNFFKRGY